MFEFAKIQLRFACDLNRWTTLLQIELLSHTSFDKNITSQRIKSVANFKDVSNRNTRKLMKNDEIFRVPVRGGIEMKHGSGTLMRKL